MKKINLVFILAIACALFVCASGVVSATTYYVPDDHEKIQWAVDNATEWGFSCVNLLVISWFIQIPEFFTASFYPSSLVSGSNLQDQSTP